MLLLRLELTGVALQDKLVPLKVGLLTSLIRISCVPEVNLKKICCALLHFRVSFYTFTV